MESLPFGPAGPGLISQFILYVELLHGHVDHKLAVVTQMGSLIHGQLFQVCHLPNGGVECKVNMTHGLNGYNYENKTQVETYLNFKPGIP